MLQSLPVSARYAAIVIDADTGRVIHETEAAQRWYPASLTKVMTLYMTFQSLEAGRLRLHDMLTVSEHAALQPSSKLGLRRGQNISVENAIMAVTTRSANDAAVLLAETLGGSETQFASMMTEQAHRLGMSSSSFHNASGLPDEGQISSARDLAILSSALIRDFPQYYRYFSATEFHYKGRVLPNTNRILKSYPDADGLKTGFTCGSGYNLIASAKRNGHRLIGVLLGAHSSAERFEQMGNLLDIGFEKSNAAGVHVSQLIDDDLSPPPFQLSSNRCAGSAMQMGADAGSSRHEAIRLKPREKHRTPSRTGNADWAVMLGSDNRKTDADASLRQARKVLGPLAKSGETQVVKIRAKGGQIWRAEWTGLQSADAKSICGRLRAKRQECTVLPGRS
ncbi:MAG: D-alanyl-D-alanine carboxypeptidase family protein [Methylomonas sp.]